MPHAMAEALLLVLLFVFLQRTTLVSGMITLDVDSEFCYYVLNQNIIQKLNAVMSPNTFIRHLKRGLQISEIFRL